MDTIGTARGIALYVGALLGPGLLVLPGLAAAAAGPASILAWAGLLILSGLVAVVFAQFGVTHRSAGGVAEYVAAGLGERAGRAAGWCFLAGIITGAPIVCTMGAGYLTADPARQALLGGALLALVVTVSRRGLRASTGVQMALVVVLVLVLVLAVGGALPSSHAANFRPFAPHGWSAIGSAAAVLMLSFIGWEAVAPLTGRFADPRRQLPRVIGAAFLITAVVYLALASVTVAVLGPRAATGVPVAALLTYSIGPAGHVVAAAAAVLLTLGAVNTYLTGGAALAGPARWFWSGIVVSGVVILSLLGLGLVPVAGAVAVPVSFFVVVYLGCMLSAVRVMSGGLRVIALAAAVVNVIVLGFTGAAAVPALLLAAVAVSPVSFSPASSSTRSARSWSASRWPAPRRR
ncbi:amino acid permease [Actinoplanes sp. NPDC051861]|uniref:APC family permease n=1 Tax=Actinoplanes sp. NPDC051861 TaxID=3155170 RepID=UPI003442A179